jgi:membrane peptidoglycan carboxypeptidase
VAATAAYALKGVMNGGTGQAGNPYDGTQLIGKTGTTDNRLHTWLAGASTTASVALWVGNVEGKVDLANISLGGNAGNSARFPIWRDIMSGVDTVLPGGVFPAPDPNLTKVITRSVPNVAGMSVETAQATIEDKGFTVTVSPDQVPSTEGAGLVARTDPAGGTNVNVGTPITIYVSNGNGATIPEVVGDRPDDAKKSIEDAGFKVKVDKNCNGDDKRVTTQNPGGDTDADKGGTVTIGCG